MKVVALARAVPTICLDTILISVERIYGRIFVTFSTPKIKNYTSVVFGPAHTQYADAGIREMRTSTIGGFSMEPSIVEVAYLPSLLAEWELKSPAGKCLAVGDE